MNRGTILVASYDRASIAQNVARYRASPHITVREKKAYLPAYTKRAPLQLNPASRTVFEEGTVGSRGFVQVRVGFSVKQVSKRRS